MTDNPYQHMARQFVDMWQRQLSDMLVDENFVANIIDTMHQTGGFPHASTSPTDTPFSPDVANAVVGQLERRLAHAEGRLAELEREMAELRRQLADGAGKRRNHENSRASGTGKTKHKPA